MQFSLLYGLNIFLCGQTRQQTIQQWKCLLYSYVGLTIHISLFLFPLHAFAIANILYSVRRNIFLRYPATRLSSEKREKQQFFFAGQKRRYGLCAIRSMWFTRRASAGASSAGHVYNETMEIRWTGIATRALALILALRCILSVLWFTELWVGVWVFVPAGRPTSRMYSAIREFHRMQAKHILTSCQARPFCPLFRTMDLTFYIYVCMCIEQRVEPTTLSIITEMAVVTWSNAFGWSVVWKLNCTTHAMHVSYLIQKATSSSECVCGGGVGGEGYGARQSTSVAAVCSFRMCIVARSMNTRKHFNEYILYVWDDTWKINCYCFARVRLCVCSPLVVFVFIVCGCSRRLKLTYSFCRWFCSRQT